MAIALKVPSVGESITEVQIGTWLKNPGDRVASDEAIVEFETDKASVELPAPAQGVLTQILKNAGETAQVGEIVGYMEEVATGAAVASESVPQPATTANAPKIERTAEPIAMPAAQRLIATAGLAVAEIEGTGPSGRILKEDVQNHIKEKRQKVEAPQTAAPVPQPTAAIAGAAPPNAFEQVVPMTPLRRKVAERLVQAQQTAALLTTFNEIDMTAVMALRKENQEAFLEAHGVKLGFMSFFVKATIEALKRIPQLNAEIRGNDIVYKNRYDIGVAIGSGKGLVVPVVRGAERMSFFEIEKAIADFAKRAQAGKLAIEELYGATFTISNGGVYGSLLSTPIVNPPQSGILGMHAIQERPVALNGQVIIRPMMYVALTYDHRIVDGREAVTFLKRIKDLIENPARMLLEI